MMAPRVLLNLLLSLLVASESLAQGVTAVHPVRPNGTALFPPAFASADNVAAQTATAMHGLMFIWDGSAWDRWTGAVTQSGTWNIGTVTSITNAVAVTGTFWQATQPVSAASLPLPSGAATSALQDGIIRDGTGDATQANVSSGRVHVDGSGVTQPVSGTVTANVGTFPDNEPFNISQMNGVAVTMGNGVSGTGVQRVTLASDSTGQVAVASLPNEGQQTSANSISVVMASDQSSLPTTEQSSTAILSGQASVTGTAAALPSNAAKEVCVKALLANTLNVYVGPSGVTTSTGMELGPGDAYCTRVTNTNALFLIASGAGPGISWAARN